jgi:pimeloyl-ACP methyl ester carboxylesterase
MEKNLLSFDGTNINYHIDRVSNKNFLVLLHGGGGDRSAWNKQLRYFKNKGYSTLAIDLRGHGKSGRPDELDNYKLEYFAKDVYEVLKHEKIKKPVIIGHCFGGMITIVFHKLYPSFAKAYVLVDTTYKAFFRLRLMFNKNMFFYRMLNRHLSNKSYDLKNYKRPNYEKFKGSGNYSISRVLSDIRHTSLKSWIFTFENIADFDGTRALKSMKQKVLVIEGERDTVYNLLVAQKIKNLVKHSELSVISDENHIIVINNPKILEKTIFEFLERIYK